MPEKKDDKVTGGVLGPSRPRPGYTKAPPGMPKRYTGAKPTPKERLAAARKFQNRPAGPAAWLWLPSKLSYWLNNVTGICVTAEEAFNMACAGYFMHDDVVGAWAKKHGVYNGAMLDQVLDWMKEHGFEQGGNVYSVGEKSVVDFTNPDQLRAAIKEGPVKLGVAAGQLLHTVGHQNGWFADHYRRDSNMDHCVSLPGYGTAKEIADWLHVTVPAGIDPAAQGYAMFTWDTVGWISDSSMRAISGEAWARTPPSVKTGTSPDDVDPVFTPEPAPTPTPPPDGGLCIILTSDLPAGRLDLEACQADIQVPTDIPAGHYMRKGQAERQEAPAPAAEKDQAAQAEASPTFACFLTFLADLAAGEPLAQCFLNLADCLTASEEPQLAGIADKVRERAQELAQ